MAEDWVTRIAGAVEARWERQRSHANPAQREAGEGGLAPIVCASGITPSGPVHLGNLREVMTVHLVAEALRSRGHRVRHLHFWDDFDRLRKVPAGVPADFERFVGRPLADVPDPAGCHASYAEHFTADFESGLERLHVFPAYVRQSEAYRAGRYTSAIRQALRARHQIFDVLASFQTAGREAASEGEPGEGPGEGQRARYYPYRLYCQACRRDFTQLEAYDDEAGRLSYRCTACGHRGSVLLDERPEGKLAWKVDWPMRWGAEGVDFEPAGADHATAGGSFEVARRLAREVFGTEPPYFVGYAFVGEAGRAKVSSSAGTLATLTAALDVLEPAIVRWLYVRRTPGQSFVVDFGTEVMRLYDEWDALGRRVAAGEASDQECLQYARATSTSAGPIPGTAIPVPFRVLASAADITQGNVEQILRIAAGHLPSPPDTETLRRGAEPRLGCAMTWAARYQPDEARTRLRDHFAAEVYAELGPESRRAIAYVLDHLHRAWTLDGLSALLYAAPKVVRGLPPQAPADEAIKRAQRAFFVDLYQLICGRDTGPRLPTLFLSLGPDRVRRLLTPPG